jgi:hypothetical protein
LHFCLDEKQRFSGNRVQHFVEKGDRNSGGQLDSGELLAGESGDLAAIAEIGIMMDQEYAVARRMHVDLDPVRALVECREDGRKRILGVLRVGPAMGYGEERSCRHTRIIAKFA